MARLTSFILIGVSTFSGIAPSFKTMSVDILIRYLGLKSSILVTDAF
jgi:hypothetical protein